MRTIPSALQAKLDEGATTLCRCWKLTRRDNAVFGFTDHDEDIAIGALTYKAGTGFDGSELASKLGLAPGGLELAGALSDDALDDADLAAGRWDGAAVEVRLVDWFEPELNIVIAAGTLGEVSRAGKAFTAEFRSPAAKLNMTTGRRYAPLCTADLGDNRCAKNLATPELTGNGMITAVEGSVTIAASGLGAFTSGWFTAGRLTWVSGANAGLKVEVKDHRLEGTTAHLTLWEAMPENIETGDGFSIEAGCDKHFATCKAKFANQENYRGFPHIPGNDFAMSYAVAGDPNLNGGPRR